MTMEWFWPEGFYALAMIVAFAVGAFAFKLPIAIAMSVSAMLGALLAGFGFPLRHLVEGMFGYIDTILIIATAMIFMSIVQAIGLMEAVAAWISCPSRKALSIAWSPDMCATMRSSICE